jgi:hypothetical protein
MLVPVLLIWPCSPLLYVLRKLRTKVAVSCGEDVWHGQKRSVALVPEIRTRSTDICMPNLLLVVVVRAAGPTACVVLRAILDSQTRHPGPAMHSLSVNLSRSVYPKEGYVMTHSLTRTFQQVQSHGR